MTRQPLLVLGLAGLAVAGMLTACTSGGGSHPAAGGSSTPAATAAPTASASLATAIPVAAGNTFLSTTVGGGQRSLGPIPSAGTVNFMVACLGAGLEVERKPDIDFTITCDGSPHAVQIHDAARGDQPLMVTAADSVSWAINAGTGG